MAAISGHCDARFWLVTKAWPGSNTQPSSTVRPSAKAPSIATNAVEESRAGAVRTSHVLDADSASPATTLAHATTGWRIASPEKATTATIQPHASQRAAASARRIVTPVGNSAPAAMSRVWPVTTPWC